MHLLGSPHPRDPSLRTQKLWFWDGELSLADGELLRSLVLRRASGAHKDEPAGGGARDRAPGDEAVTRGRTVESDREPPGPGDGDPLRCSTALARWTSAIVGRAGAIGSPSALLKDTRSSELSSSPVSEPSELSLCSDSARSSCTLRSAGASCLTSPAGDTRPLSPVNCFRSSLGDRLPAVPSLKAASIAFRFASSAVWSARPKPLPRLRRPPKEHESSRRIGAGDSVTAEVATAADGRLSTGDSPRLGVGLALPAAGDRSRELSPRGVIRAMPRRPQGDTVLDVEA